MSITVLDWIALSLFVVFAALGVFRGARWQFRRFLGVLLGIAVAGFLAPLLAPYVTVLIDRQRPRVGLGVSYLLIFFFSLAILALLFHFLKPQAARSRRQNEEGGEVSKHRFLGACFGGLTAVALILVAASALSLFGAEEDGSAQPQKSKSLALSRKVISNLGGCFPLETRQAK